MTKEIVIRRAAPLDAINILKFMRKVHERHHQNLPEIVDRYTLIWISEIIAFGICFNACIDGRLVGSMGAKKESMPWNPYQHHLDTKWLHVLDSFIDGDVRDSLIIAMRREADKQKRLLKLTIQPELHRERDSVALTASHHSYLLEPNQ
ncbi:MAG: hypothetical protein ACXWYM_00250 [Candidatus Binatia bacterium]